MLLNVFMRYSMHATVSGKIIFINIFFTLQLTNDRYDKCVNDIVTTVQTLFLSTQLTEDRFFHVAYVSQNGLT